MKVFETDRLERDNAKVNPNHYSLNLSGRNKGLNELEVYDVVDALQLDFESGNAVTYILRSCRADGLAKHDEDSVGERVVDVKKAVWYLNKWVEKHS